MGSIDIHIGVGKLLNMLVLELHSLSMFIIKLMDRNASQNHQLPQ